MASKIELRTEQKQKFFDEYMNGDHVLVCVDTRKSGVAVPQHLSGSPACTLKLSYLFQGKTEHDQQEIRAYLRFGGEYFQCILPWTTIWQMTASSGQSQIWPEDAPPEVVIQLAKTELMNLGRKIFGKGSAPKEAKTEPRPVADSAEPSKKRTTPQLKRIK